MPILKRIKAKKGEMTLGVLLAAFVSILVILFCLIQMEDHKNVKLAWYLYFIAGNTIYVIIGTDRGWIKYDPANILVVVSGPLAFFFWTIVGAWNKYVESLSKTHTVKQSNSVPKPTTVKEIEKPCNVTIRSFTDVLRDLNDEITEKLKRFDVFDIEVPEISIKQFLRVIKKRNLDWRPTDFVCDNKETIVVGKKGVDFGQYEKGR